MLIALALAIYYIFKQAGDFLDAQFKPITFENGGGPGVTFTANEK